MKLPNRPIPKHYAATTLIQFPQLEGHATGFFYGNNVENLYLITNEHVVNPEEKGNPDEIRIILRGKQNAANISFCDISLVDDSGNATWLTHPSDSSVDIAAVPLNIDLREYGNLALDQNLFLPSDINMSAGEQAMIIGYPFKGASPYLPVARSALIASPYGAPFEGWSCFATDANMHSGTSGSPVFTIPSAVQQRGGSISFMGGKQAFFLGVHSAALYSAHDDAEGPLNLNLTWYAELIEEII